eukprot:TRINITY_DN10923_c0_g2_i1.p1 TRINITY_DN10923_c0_g2~~TRINITY_DN10923_c0_g2_i1.p1  ORF type:complete len:532 (-),score=75.52 TRINITY_DN10923_c0_g2_i1:266-1792(-)
MTSSLLLHPNERWFLQNSLYTSWYNKAFFVTSERLDLGLFSQAWDRVVAHFEVLRYRYWWDDEKRSWYRSVASSFSPTSLDCLDLSSVEESKHVDWIRVKSLEVLSKAKNYIMTSPPASHELNPLVRFLIIEFGGEKPQGVVRILNHHIADGVTGLIFTEALSCAYFQLKNDQPVTLLEQPLTYSDFSLIWSAYDRYHSRLRMFPCQDKKTTERWQFEWWEKLKSRDRFHVPIDHYKEGAGFQFFTTLKLSLTHTNYDKLMERVKTMNISLSSLLLCIYLIILYQKCHISSGLVNMILHGRVLPSLHQTEGYCNFKLPHIQHVKQMAGWCAVFSPEHFSIDPQASLTNNCIVLHEQIKGIKNGGMDFRIHESFKERSFTTPIGQAPTKQPSTSFNYLGNLKRAISTTSRPLLIPQSLGLGFVFSQDVLPVPSPSPVVTLMGNLLHTNHGTEIILTFAWNENFYTDSTISRLATEYAGLFNSFLDELQASCSFSLSVTMPQLHLQRAML